MKLKKNVKDKKTKYNDSHDRDNWENSLGYVIKFSSRLLYYRDDKVNLINPREKTDDGNMKKIFWRNSEELKLRDR